MSCRSWPAGEIGGVLVEGLDEGLDGVDFFFLEIGFAALGTDPGGNGVEGDMTARTVEVEGSGAALHPALATDAFHFFNLLLRSLVHRTSSSPAAAFGAGHGADTAPSSRRRPAPKLECPTMFPLLYSTFSAHIFQSPGGAEEGAVSFEALEPEFQDPLKPGNRGRTGGCNTNFSLKKDWPGIQPVLPTPIGAAAAFFFPLFS